MSQKPEPPVITTQPINNHGALDSENHELIGVHNGNNDSEQFVVITTQPTNETEVLNSETHELIPHTSDDTQLNPSTIPMEQQEELKQKAQEESQWKTQEEPVGCCEAIMDCIDICTDFMWCGAGHYIFPCCNNNCFGNCCSDCCNDNCWGDCCNDNCCGDCCNDNCCGDCCNDNCCGDCCNDDGGGGGDLSCIDACCGDGCCED